MPAIAAADFVAVPGHSSLHSTTAAARGIENLGPWDDFEWGMINGKLSDLGWIMRDEWDMLDT
jgi:hypothetical protein